MKKNLLIMIAGLLVLSSQLLAQAQQPVTGNQQNEARKVNGPVAKWDMTENNSGDIPLGVPRPFQFTLTNSGNEPLIISSAQASCGCTGLNYSKEPILPGKSTTISATYNAAVKGNFYKSITVRTNANDQPTVLLIKGNVIEKPAEEKK